MRPNILMWRWLSILVRSYEPRRSAHGCADRTARHARRLFPFLSQAPFSTHSHRNPKWSHWLLSTSFIHARSHHVHKAVRLISTRFLHATAKTRAHSGGLNVRRSYSYLDMYKITEIGQELNNIYVAFILRTYFGGTITWSDCTRPSRDRQRRCILLNI